VIAQHPQERRIGRGVDLEPLVVDGYKSHRSAAAREIR
jgi:hypothetical protein